MNRGSHQILREIAPDSFHEGAIKQNVGTNAILKVRIALLMIQFDFSRNVSQSTEREFLRLRHSRSAVSQANNIKRLMKDLDAYYRGVFLQSFDVDSVNPTAVAAGEADEVCRKSPPTAPPTLHHDQSSPLLISIFRAPSVVLMTMNTSPVPALALRR